MTGSASGVFEESQQPNVVAGQTEPVDITDELPTELMRYPNHIEGLPAVDASGNTIESTSEKPWVKTVLPASARHRLQPGDGFDVYVDGARFLPDNVTVSRVVCKVMDPSFGLVGSEFTSAAALDSETLSPSFRAYGSYRIGSASSGGSP